MGFGSNEDRIIRNLDNKNRAEEIKDWAESLLSYYPTIERQMKKLEIDMEDFRGFYPDKRIDDDLAYVKRMEARFAKTDQEQIHGSDLTKGDVRKLAEIAEFGIIAGVRGGGWLPYGNAYKTSRYDDIANGIDAGLEFTPPGQMGHFGLNVDVSFSHNLDQKFERVKREIDEFDPKANPDQIGSEGKQLGTIRYYQSPRFKGRLTGIPRVVMALDLGVIQDIFTQKNLRGHIARHSVLIEIEQQLKVFTDYAGDTGSAAYDQLKQAQSFISAVSKVLDSEEQLKKSEYRKNKEVETAITRGLQVFQ